MRKPAVFMLMCLLIGSVTAKTQEQALITTRAGESGHPVTVSFEPGKEWVHTFRMGGVFPLANRPQIAVWAEHPDGRYLETLYVTHRAATQDWRTSNPRIRRLESLPCWAHHRGVLSEDGFPLPTKRNPLPDAVTAATPKGKFTLDTVIPNGPGKVFIYAELNHSYDFNDAFPRNTKSVTGNSALNGQPSAIYAVEVDFSNPVKTYEMRLVGYGSPDGSDGRIYPDVSALTTAKGIVDRIIVRRK